MPLEYQDKVNPKGRADLTELIADWIVSDTNNPATAKWDRTTVLGRPGIYSTSHMKGRSPEGSNVL